MILIKLDARNFVAKLNRYERSIPEALSYAGGEIAFELEKELKNSITQKKLIWTGRLLARTYAARRSKNIFEVRMPSYGVALDRMRTHWVSLKRGRKITQWAKDNLNLEARVLYPGKAIRVRAHPFIERPIYLVNRRIKRIVRKNMKLAMRK